MEQQILQQILSEIKEIRANQEGLSQKIDNVQEGLNEKIDKVYEEFDKVYTEFDKVYTEFDKVYTEFDKVYAEIERTERRLTYTIDAKTAELERRLIYTIDVKTAELDKKIDSVERKLSKNLGVHGRYILDDVVRVSNRLDNIIEKNNLVV